MNKGVVGYRVFDIMVIACNLDSVTVVFICGNVFVIMINSYFLRG